jgi:DNA mismatch repair protein MutS
MSSAPAATPLLEQYEGVKARYPGHLILFRVGDFFETFGDDARLLSRELDVVLTARSPDTQGQRTPMAGVPQHAIEVYLGRLVRKGYKVALCDQVEDARFAKGLVRREVTRVVTPGTVVEDGILGGPDHSFLASVELGAEGPGAFAAVDLTTGEWLSGLGDGGGAEGVASALAPLDPREIVWSAPASDAPALLAILRREFPRARLEEAPAPISMAELPPSLATGTGALPTPRPLDLRLAAYVRATQPRLLPHLSAVERAPSGRRLVLDGKTLRHLEVSRPMNPDDPRGATLLDAWDETVTAPGRRTLGFWLTNPLADPDAIGARLDAVEALCARGARLDALRERLHEIADVSRIASRVAGRRVHPPELAALRSSLRSVAAVRRELESGPLTTVLRDVAGRLAPPDPLVELLTSALPEVPPPLEDEPGLFLPGHAAEVDRCREAERTALDALAALEKQEQAATGIKGLKVGYNQVFGYYFEVTRAHLGRVPPHFRRRQTVSQAERFVTEELAAIDDRLRIAREAYRSAASERWEQLLATVDAEVASIHRLARAVGELDVLATFAYLARERGYVRPVVDAGGALTVRDGRHPVLDRSLAERFVPNDVDLDRETRRLLVLTGPNMSGKSTYMRAVGLLVVLAQAGSFVPARYARIGTVTQLFTRMGFTDEIGRGKSSFMVEMAEVADILRRADDRSLVLLDEVGRGTSTFDGLAIAWATLRHLHDVIRARSLLATHYHQLTELVGGLAAAANAHFGVQDRPDGIVFLHRLVPGATDRSYGVHVARLAGVPEDVLREAERTLRALEAEGIPVGTAAKGRGRERGPRYTQAVLVPGAQAPDPVGEALRRIEVDRLTPDEALEALRGLKRQAEPSSRETP